ncbi:hypothetical protein GGF31_006134 [Allomyces arbusculus]|nr:hypothetical protein GGF31_006134 [Allomyces arbusculus]
MTHPADRERWSGTTANASDPLLPSSPYLSRPSLRRDRLAELHAAIIASPIPVSTTASPSRAPPHVPSAPSPTTTTTWPRPGTLLSPTKSVLVDPSSHLTWSDTPTAATATIPSPTLAKTALLTSFLDDVASVTTTLAQVRADLGDLHAAQTAALRTSSTAVTVPTPPHDRAWLASTTRRLHATLAECRDTTLPALAARLHADLARDPDSSSFCTAASAHLRSVATKYDACSRILITHCTNYTAQIRARLVRELRVVHPDADPASLDAYLDADPDASPPPNRGVVGGNAVTGIFAYEILRARSGLVTGMPPAARAAFQGIHDRHVELRELERGVEMVKGLLVDVERMLAPPLVVIRKEGAVGRVETPSEVTREVERASLRESVESEVGEEEKGVDKVGRELRDRVARAPWYLCLLVIGVLAIVALVVGATVWASSRANLVDIRLQREGAATTTVVDWQPTLTDDATSWPASTTTKSMTTELTTTTTSTITTTTIHAAVVTSTLAPVDRASPVLGPTMVVGAPSLAPATPRL